MSSPAGVMIVDTETTGLDPDRHEIWELALIDRETGTERLWRMKPDLAKAEPQALAVGRFYERTRDMRGAPRPVNLASPGEISRDGYLDWTPPRTVAAVVAPLLADVILLAANPAFDAAFLAAFLRVNGQAPAWHYRLRDIGSMAWAWLQAHHLPHHLDTPLISSGTDDLALAMGIDPARFERHSALGDCRLVGAMLDRITGGAA